MKSPFKLLQLLLAALLLSFALAACGPADEAAGDAPVITDVQPAAVSCVPFGAYTCKQADHNLRYFPIYALSQKQWTYNLCMAAITDGTCPNSTTCGFVSRYPVGCTPK